MKHTMDLGSIEMAAEARLDLNCERACGTNACATALGCLIAFDHCDAGRLAPFADRCLEQGGLPGTRCTQQVDREALTTTCEGETQLTEIRC